MGNILITMPKTEDSLRIEKLLQSRGVQLDTEICQTGSEILRLVNDRDFGVVICTGRLKDMSCSELSEYLPITFGLIVLTNDVSLELYSDSAIKLMMPFKAGELISTIEVMTQGFFRRDRKKKKPEHKPKERSAEEQQIIDKAKLMLIDRNGMSEPEAFRYIQKTSMDTGRTMLETAQMILLMDNG